jgi:hypothetical protein
MPKYIVRIELHGAEGNGDIYEKLHVAMEAQGLSRTITGDDGNLWKLPTAMYQANSTWAIAPLRAHLKKIADGVWAGGWVFVADYSSAAWNTQRA